MNGRALCTFGIGPLHRELLEISMPLFAAYARRHSYDLLSLARLPAARPASWWKIQALLQALQTYDAALWIDCDVVIVNGRSDLAAAVPDDKALALVVHHTGDGEVPNCGVLFVRRAAAPLLREAWEQRDLIYAGWWEQEAIMRLLGYDLRRPTRLERATEWYTRAHFLDTSWNSHPWDPAPQTRFAHATMFKDRAGTMRRWAALAEWAKDGREPVSA